MKAISSAVNYGKELPPVQLTTAKKETSLVSRDDFKHITMKQKKEKNT